MTRRSTAGIDDDLYARWVASGDRASRDVLDPLGLSPRLTRLFAVAVCRDVWDFLTDERSRAAVEVAERFSDGHATVRERRAAYRAASDAYFIFCEEFARSRSPAASAASQATAAVRYAVDTHANAGRAAGCAAGVVRPGVQLGDLAERSWRREREGELLVAIVGTGYELLPEWRTADAMAIARTCYDTRDWSLMPILADALQDAGCENEDVLGHCRGSGPHVRGDWVVDSLLGLS